MINETFNKLPLSAGDASRLFAAEDVKDGVAVLRSGKKNYFVLKVS